MNVIEARLTLVESSQNCARLKYDEKLQYLDDRLELLLVRMGELERDNRHLRKTLSSIFAEMSDKLMEEPPPSVLPSVPEATGVPPTPAALSKKAPSKLVVKRQEQLFNEFVAASLVQETGAELHYPDAVTEFKKWRQHLTASRYGILTQASFVRLMEDKLQFNTDDIARVASGWRLRKDDE